MSKIRYIQLWRYNIAIITVILAVLFARVDGSREHSTLGKFLLGSITKMILKESSVPVFLCH